MATDLAEYKVTALPAYKKQMDISRKIEGWTPEVMKINHEKSKHFANIGEEFKTFAKTISESPVYNNVIVGPVSAAAAKPAEGGQPRTPQVFKIDNNCTLGKYCEEVATKMSEQLSALSKQMLSGEDVTNSPIKQNMNDLFTQAHAAIKVAGLDEANKFKAINDRINNEIAAEMNWLRVRVERAHDLKWSQSIADQFINRDNKYKYDLSYNPNLMGTNGPKVDMKDKTLDKGTDANPSKTDITISSDGKGNFSISTHPHWTTLKGMDRRISLSEQYDALLANGCSQISIPKLDLSRAHKVDHLAVQQNHMDMLMTLLNRSMRIMLGSDDPNKVEIERLKNSYYLRQDPVTKELSLYFIDGQGKIDKLQNSSDQLKALSLVRKLGGEDIKFPGPGETVAADIVKANATLDDITQLDAATGGPRPTGLQKNDPENYATLLSNMQYFGEGPTNFHKQFNDIMKRTDAGYVGVKVSYGLTNAAGITPGNQNDNSTGRVVPGGGRDDDLEISQTGQEPAEIIATDTENPTIEPASTGSLDEQAKAVESLRATLEESDDTQKEGNDKTPKP